MGMMVDAVLQKVAGLRDSCSAYRLRQALETTLRVGLAEARVARAEPFSDREREMLRLTGVALLSDLYACERQRCPERARVWGYAVMDDCELERVVRERADRTADELMKLLEVGPYAK